MFVEVNNQVQISMKKLSQEEKVAFMESLKERGYDHDISIGLYDVGLLVDTETQTILQVMNGKLLFTPGVSAVPTVRAINF